MARILVCMLSALVLVAPSASAAWLEGTAVDALDGRPLAGIEVRVEGISGVTHTDGDGRYRLEVAPGTWRLRFEGEGHRPAILANQKSPDGRLATIHLWPREFPGDFVPGEPSFGIGQGTGPDPEPSGPVRLPRSPWLADVPAALPATIRVARYFADGCTGSIQRIDTLDFEDYLKGVVNAEVGVFRGVDGGPQAAAESWKTFAVAARSYALHFVLTTTHTDYDINDTACNQRYKDDRDPDVSAAVEATTGQILVKAQDPDVLDRYFYAASCAHHGTEPAYNPGNILPDDTLVRACVGSWCGHDNCAGHADNPYVPGDDRCLVWGTCQWGSIERSMAGQSYVEILAHYQPMCTLRDLSGPATGTLRGVVYRNPDLNDRIAGAVVTLQDGPSVIYDGVTPWEFVLEPGTYTVTAEADGYLPGSVTRAVTAHETIWGSIGLDPVGDDGGTQDASTDAGADADSDAGTDGSAPSDPGGVTPAGEGCGCSVPTGSGCLPPGLALLVLAFPIVRRRVPSGKP